MRTFPEILSASLQRRCTSDCRRRIGSFGVHTEPPVAEMTVFMVDKLNFFAVMIIRCFIQCANLESRVAEETITVYKWSTFKDSRMYRFKKSSL